MPVASWVAKHSFFHQKNQFFQIWQLSTKGQIMSHRYSRPISNSFLVGAKFLDPKGASFAVASYDSNKIQIFVM